MDFDRISNKIINVRIIRSKNKNKNKNENNVNRDSH